MENDIKIGDIVKLVNLNNHNSRAKKYNVSIYFTNEEIGTELEILNIEEDLRGDLAYEVKCNAGITYLRRDAFELVYSFPKDNWYLKIDDDNRDIVNNWRINIKKYSPSPCEYPYINWEGGGELGWFCVGEITTDQFKKYVLNQKDIDKKLENLDYLIELFKKLNIE